MNVDPHARQLALRKARITDCDELIALHRLALRAISPVHYTRAQIDSTIRYLTTLDRELIGDGTYFVIEADLRIVACGGWTRRRPSYASMVEPPGRSGSAGPARIRAMYTHPQWARRGLGRRILSAAEAEIAGTGVAVIELEATLSGVPLYERAGYRGGKTMRMRFPDGEVLELVRMSKRSSRRNADANGIERPAPGC